MTEEVVGRTREVEAIDRFVDDLPAGHRSLMIAGEAGIGKTTLWRIGVGKAERRAYHVCRCRPAQAETGMAFSALIDLLEEIPEDALESLPGPQRRALEIALLRREPEGRSVDQRAVARAVLGILESLAEAGPVVVAVDDVQWLDPSSARVLQFVFRRITDASIGLLASVRTGSPTAVIEPLSESHSTELLVGSLSLGAIDRLIRTRLDSQLPRPLLVRIHEISGGNPFLALEIARGLERRGVRPRPGETLPIPANLSDLVSERLSALDPDARSSLLVAAACSHPTVALVSAAVGHDVQDAMDRAISTAVIDPIVETIEFTHPLLASVLYADASPSERRDAHERLAAAVTDPEERARHLGLAATGSDPTVATALDDAARLARARGAASAAAELSLLARDLTPPDRVPEAAARVMAAAHHYYAAGDAAPARALLDELVQTLFPGPLRASALHQLATIAYHLDSYDEAARLLEQALDEAGAEAATSGRAHEALAWVKVQQGDVVGAGRHAEEAVALGEDARDEEVFVAAATLAVFTRFLLGEGVDENLMARALALEDHASHLPAERRPGPLFGLITAWDDRMHEGRRQLLRALDRCMDGGDEGALPVVWYFLAHVEWHLGMWGDASDHLEVACDLAKDMGSEGLLAFALAVNANIAATTGRIEEAESLVARSARLAEKNASPMGFVYNACAAGELALTVGEHAAAHEQLGEMAATMVGMPADPGLIARVCGDDAEALIALGMLDAAEELVVAMESKARAVGSVSLSAVTARCRALLLAARGDIDGAADAIAVALEAHERATRPFERARSLLVQGTISRRARRKRAARVSLEEAIAVFLGLGAQPWADRARAEIARLGGRPPAPSELTASEIAVADAVTRGLTNKETAAELFMSVNTVEAYLKRIFRKLGVRSRTELAARYRAPVERG